MLGFISACELRDWARLIRGMAEEAVKEKPRVPKEAVAGALLAIAKGLYKPRVLGQTWDRAEGRVPVSFVNGQGMVYTMLLRKNADGTPGNVCHVRCVGKDGVVEEAHWLEWGDEPGDNPMDLFRRFDRDDRDDQLLEALLAADAIFPKHDTPVEEVQAEGCGRNGCEVLHRPGSECPAPAANELTPDKRAESVLREVLVGKAEAYSVGLGLPDAEGRYLFQVDADGECWQFCCWACHDAIQHFLWFEDDDEDRHLVPDTHALLGLSFEDIKQLETILRESD